MLPLDYIPIYPVRESRDPGVMSIWQTDGYEFAGQHIFSDGVYQPFHVSEG
jgi:hypothetical protein